MGNSPFQKGVLAVVEASSPRFLAEDGRDLEAAYPSFLVEEDVAVAVAASFHAGNIAAMASSPSSLVEDDVLAAAVMEVSSPGVADLEGSSPDVADLEGSSLGVADLEGSSLVGVEALSFPVVVVVAEVLFPAAVAALFQVGDSA